MDPVPRQGGVGDLLSLLIRSSGLLHRSLGCLLRAEGSLSFTEAVVLFVLHRRGEQRLTDLSQFIGIPASTLTGLVDRLEGRGLVRRRRDGADRRHVFVAATPRVDAWMDAMLASLEREVSPRLAALPPEVVPRLTADLALVAQALENVGREGDPPHGRR